jgi:hypothetical protein
VPTSTDLDWKVLSMGTNIFGVDFGGHLLSVDIPLRKDDGS